jgi:hypothetical protein
VRGVRETDKRADALARYVTLRRSSDATMLLCEAPLELTLGSHRLEKDLVSRLSAAVRRTHPQSISIDGSRITAVFHDTSTLTKLRVAIDRVMSAFEREKLHPQVVQEILHITPRERIRWTKDGRLRQAGKGVLSSGWQTVHFPLYRRDQILELRQSPATIAAWRKPAADHPA